MANIKSVNKNLTKMLKNLELIEKQFVDTGKVMESGLSAIDNQAKKSLTAQQQLTGAKKEHREEISKEQKQAQELIRAKNDLQKASTKQAQLTLQLKKQKQDLIKQQKLEMQAGKGQAKTYEQLSARYRLAAKSAKDLTVQYGANSKKAREAIKTAKGYNNELKKIDGSLGNHQRNVGNYGDSLNRLGGPIGGVIAGMKAMAKVIFATPLGWLIGLIAIAGAALKTFFTGSAEGQERWTKTVNRAKAVLSVFKDELIKIGKTISNFTDSLKLSEGGIRGWATSVKEGIGNTWDKVKKSVSDGTVWEDLKNNVTGAIDSVKAKFSELGDAIDENQARADEISRRQNALRRDEIASLTSLAKLRKEIANARAKAADKENVSAFERIRLLDEATKKQNEILTIEENLLSEKIKIQELEMAQGENRLEDYEELANLEAQLINLQTANAEKRRRFTSEQLSSIRELKKEQEAFRKSISKGSDEALKAIESENAGFLDEFEKGLDAEEKALEDSLKRQEDARVKSGEKEIADAEEKSEKIAEAAKQGGDLLLDIITMFADQRLEQANRIVEEESMKTDSAERNLDRQITLAEAGHASDVAGAQKALDLQKATQDKALAEKKRALDQKQKLETIEQGISIITSVANIIQGFSAIPIVGWILGIAAGAAMLAAFANQKRQAKTATQSFGEGGVVDLEGGSHASGNDVHFGNKGGKELHAEGGEKAAIFSKKATRKYGGDIDRFVRDANRLRLEERYTNAFNLGALPIIVESNSNFDSKETNNLLRKLIEQGSGSDIFDPVKGRQISKKGNVTTTTHG
jgi:hypothetical protein